MTDLSDAHARGPSDKAAIQRRLRAETWRFDAGLERAEELIAAGALEPSPTLRLQLGHYRIARDAARAEGIDTSPPPEGEAA